MSYYKFGIDIFGGKDFTTHIITDIGELHIHDFFEISYTIRGSVRHVTVNTEELFSNDRFLILRPDDAHAFDDCDMSDVIFQYDHEGRVFARNKNKTLELTPDEKGLKVRAYLGGTDIGRQLYQEIKGGYTDKMSFGFIVAEDRTEETNLTDKTEVLRTILSISKLYDVSAVSIPANDATSISARNYCDGEIARIKAERLKEQEAEETRLHKIKELELKMKLMEV